jgi:ribosome biogenesis ATPase
MQGLWTNHRRSTKINLNSPLNTPVPGSPHPQPPEDGQPQPGAEQPDANLQELASPAIAKRKTRITRTEDTKRLKTNAIAKDYTPPTIRLSDLGGVDGCVERMLELVAMPLCHPEIYLHTGVQPPRGVLLHGPPGCGKTLLANAIAGVSGIPFMI